MGYRYTVITCNFGGYEIMREIQNPLKEVEYLYITDDINITSNTWNVIYDKFYDNFSNPFDKVVMFRSRVLEYTHSDFCVRIDASIQINGFSFENIINEMNLMNSDISFIISPRFNTILDEMLDWEYQRNIPREKLEHFINYYNFHEKNFDLISKNSICTLGILIQKNNQLNKDINAKQISVLNEIKDFNNELNFYRVDQIVFTYVINKFFNGINVLPLEYSVISNEYTKICIHNTNTTLYDVGVSKMNTLYLFNEPISRLFNGFNYNIKLSKNDIINDSKKIHINLPKELFNNENVYNARNNEYKKWLEREDVNIINVSDIKQNGGGFLSNKKSYEYVLPTLCKVLDINFNKDEFVEINYYGIDLMIPKKTIASLLFVPILTIGEGNYVYIQYEPLESLKKVDNFSLVGFSNDVVYNETIQNNNLYTKQCCFSMTPFKIVKDRIKQKNERVLLVITDGSIIPYIHILNYYFYKVIVIDNVLNNMSFDFLYAYEDVTDILIMTSQNKPLSLIIDNL